MRAKRKSESHRINSQAGLFGFCKRATPFCERTADFHTFAMMPSCSTHETDPRTFVFADFQLASRARASLKWRKIGIFRVLNRGHAVCDRTAGSRPFSSMPSYSAYQTTPRTFVFADIPLALQTRASLKWTKTCYFAQFAPWEAGNLSLTLFQGGITRLVSRTYPIFFDVFWGSFTRGIRCAQRENPKVTGSIPRLAFSDFASGQLRFANERLIFALSQ
jgi:hypothetical protein